MIQDISPYVFHNEYEDRMPKADDTVFSFHGRNVLTAKTDDGGYRFPAFSELESQSDALNNGDLLLRYLFRISDRCFYLLLSATPEAPPAEIPDYFYTPLMDIRSRRNTVDAFASLTAFHLFTWYDKNRFCGRCGLGEPLVHDKKERMLRCPHCGNMVFPTIAPAVIVGVTWGDKLLMTKYANREYGGWALIAGFCEIGEEVEATVHREVFEEAGIRVKNLRYVASQPWGSDSNILMGYFCELDGEAGIHMDREELSRALWVDRADVPDMSDNLSLTGYLIELFRQGKEYEEA